ncbi:MAG: 3-phosphoshikimate 1-carboxyvinyltransferase [Sinomicrobium sp.]|nr:3-phosphoshikimate 1-carboxyvinyltransferase [Sinomicrobium sp.]
MNLLLSPPAGTFREITLNITGSKSESNRLLLLQALYPSVTIKNSSRSDDTMLMHRALNSPEDRIDIRHAGTAMRFLTAFFAMREGREVILTGSDRMKERPVAVLVDALRQLGAVIHYEEKEGFPPLRIKGTPLHGSKVTMQAGISSQYVSALLLIAPKLPNGLELTLKGKITSLPYIHMTLGLLHKIGVTVSFGKNTIMVKPLTAPPKPCSLTVEPDWSSASYFYSIVALSKPGTRIALSSYRKDSLQGDAAVAAIYRKLGVSTQYTDHSIILLKDPALRAVDRLTLNLSNTPDIAQTIAVSCFGLGIGCTLSGLHTLRIKETDRLKALRTELSGFGASVTVTDEELFLEPSAVLAGPVVNTYNDHRMAMAFAPLALKTPVTIRDAGVVSKSCPDFWKDMEKLGFNITRLL